MSARDGMQVPDGAAPYRGASPWAFAVKYQFTRSDRKILSTLPLKDMSLELQEGSQSLWIVAKWPSGGGLAIRTSFSPEEGLCVTECSTTDSQIEVRANSPAGDYRVMLELPDLDHPLVHFRVWLTPEGDLNIPFWPSDTYPLDAHGDPIGSRGTVHAGQRGTAMGFVYASLTEPKSGSFLYFQNLSSLKDYCEQTQTSPDTRVGGSWPELGYTLPIAERRPLQPGREVLLSDGYVCFSPVIPDATGDLAQLFFDMLAEIYLQIERPNAEYQDWLPLAEETVRDLEHPDCITKVKGKRYLSAYVGTGNRRPESLVQLAVALPLLEYEDWRGRKVHLVDELRETLPTFYDREVKCLMRYPMSVKNQQSEDVDEKSAYEIDSWYLYHPLINLARLARRGHKDAEKLLLDSIDYATDAAHHFDYRWPVIFDGKTFETIREAPTRELGETDVAALYAYLMLEVRDITGDERYLEEAKKAAEHLKGLHFNVGYQFNNTAWGANALARLWQETGNADYLHLSYMCVASILQNAFIWDCDYGYARHYVTFFGVTPLREATYIAAYEEMEIVAAMHEYLKLVGGHISPSMHLLIAEYCKYATDGKICAFPSKLPPEAICEQPRNGHINRSLAIPLEDLYEGWQKAGQVGQEVYGGGTAPAIVARSFHHVDHAPFLLYCQYPVYDLCTGGDKTSCTFGVRGDPRATCKIRIVPHGEKSPEDLVLTLTEGKKEITARPIGDGHIEYEVPGGSRIGLKWSTRSGKRAGKRQLSKASPR